MLRIIQECITNSVRHGQAGLVTLKIERSTASPQPPAPGSTTPSFEVLVIDNGVGINNANAVTRGGGRGLANIKARANALGGAFTLHSTATETIARLSL